MFDFDEIKNRYEAFWNKSHIDRCCLYITKPCNNPFVHENPEQKWADIEFRCKRTEFEINNKVYFADAFPYEFVDFGPGSLAEFLGGSFKWAEDTVWYDQNPIIEDFENLPGLKLNKESYIFKLADLYTEKLLEKGGLIPSVPDIGGVVDTVAALRGSQNLLYDLYDYPEEVLSLVKRLIPVWMETFVHFSDRLLKRTGFTASWMNLLSDTAYYPLQCDFSAMISPDMFEEFVIPELEYFTEHLPRTVYHLDGVEATRHLDRLLELKGLDAIQWSPGAGKADVSDEVWFDMYRKIQAAGKGIILLGTPADGVERIVKSISPDGLFISTECDDEKFAEEIIRIAER